MDTDDKKQLDSSIFTHLRHFWEQHRFFGVLTYVSDDRLEVSTREFLRYCLIKEIPVAVPFCLPERCEMLFYRITAFSDLRPGFYGLSEPDIQRCAIFQTNEQDKLLCLVPGLAFSPDGYRLGFGKGYYDRFLTLFSGTTVGLCYDAFVTPTLPTDAYDRAVDCLMTEKGLYDSPIRN